MNTDDHDHTDLSHRPGCHGDAGTSSTIGHSSTVTRCLGCGAMSSERHVHLPSRQTRKAKAPSGGAAS